MDKSSPTGDKTVTGETSQGPRDCVPQKFRRYLGRPADGQLSCVSRDRDSKFPGLFDTVLRDAGIEVVLSGSRCRK